MANGPGLSTPRGREVYVGNEFRESLTLLDVLYANHFEGEHLPPELVRETEENFFRGAPPLWLNFHISAQAESGGAGVQLIRRDGYDALIQQIQQSRKFPAISTVKLFHQPGCGGTTLAMQVLWDLRKTFRCAVLRSSNSDMTNVAKAVVQLFSAGSRDLQNTVLLLLNDEQILDNLEEKIKEEIAAKRIVPKMPVVVLFCCSRKNALLQGNYIVLGKTLSDTEMQQFSQQKNELRKQYPDQHEQLHGFNILQTNFSNQYASKPVSDAFKNTLNAKRKKAKTRLVAFLALLNSYVPGSYLLESECLEFLKQRNRDISLLDRMRPFSNLIVTFTQNTIAEKRVKLAHHMIAQSCIALMANRGVTRSVTARNFINFFCRDEVPQYLLDFIKDMLTKREQKEEENLFNGTEIREEKFSRLILDIQRIEGNSMSASVLKVASNKIKYPNKMKNQFFPQALARFYYIEIKNYDQAEKWAKEAKKRDSSNSFIADTLGQVYKNHLKSRGPSVRPREILQLATKAIEAFKDEEQLAENECGTDMREHGNDKVSHVHNSRGMFGYLQVCDILYDTLVRQDEIWKNVLTNNKSLGSVLDSLGDNKLFRFNVLIKSLKNDVKEKCDFLNTFLTYSKPGRQKQDPSECWRNVSTCYEKYLERPKPDLVKEIMDKLEDDNEEKMSVESCIAAVLKDWSTRLDNKDNSPNLMQLIDKTKHFYGCAFAKYLRSRYLRPLFYLGRDEAVGKIVPANDVHCLLGDQDKTEDFTNYMINKDRIFRDLRVQKRLFKCEGKVQDYSITTKVGGHDITMKANMKESTWFPCQVSFYIGVTINGPVAFGIQSKSNRSPSTSETRLRNTQTWTAVNPKHTTTNSVTTYSLQSEAGKFQCAKSGLRWACSGNVSFTYQFKSWEDHQGKLKKVCCTPGGPLLTIKVTDGKFDNVYLPHRICMDNLESTSEKFAVLHSGKVGNFLEEVSEVESSHVKLLHLRFTTHGVVIRKGC